MDAIDLALLRAVQEDGRLTLMALGQRVGLTEAPVQRRLRALEAGGWIAAYVALVDGSLIGLDFEVFVEVQLAQETPGGLRDFEDQIEELEPVVECHRVSGDFQYLLKVVTADPPSFSAFHGERLLRLPGVLRTRQTVSLRRVKRTTRLPIEFHTAGRSVLVHAEH
jgi:DNA-binding Lrp family transcriptional regulator